MKKCKHKNIIEDNIISGGYNIPSGTIEEYDIICKDCGKWLAHWSYGGITDFSKDGEKILFKRNLFRKIIDYFKYKVQYIKIKNENKNEKLPF